jgi:hypothetical protein
MRGRLLANTAACRAVRAHLWQGLMLCRFDRLRAIRAVHSLA